MLILGLWKRRKDILVRETRGKGIEKGQPKERAQFYPTQASHSSERLTLFCTFYISLPPDPTAPMLLQSFMPSFNLGSRPAVKQDASRPILRSIGNQEDPKKMKSSKPLVDIKNTVAATANTTGHSLSAMPLAVKKAEIDVRPMDVDLPRSTWPALPPGVEDIDDEEADNPLLVAEYVNDIYAYMRDLEVRCRKRAINRGRKIKKRKSMSHHLSMFIIFFNNKKNK